PSLMRGDDVVLGQLRQLTRRAYAGGSRWDRRLYLYVTATDLFGYDEEFGDSTGRRFKERDHRRVFGFQHEPGRTETERANGALRPTVWLGDPDAPELLARAARSSSSFPVAFEAHRTRVEDSDGETSEHWLVDGGILDNQPFNPVLDRIAVLPADCPVRRVVMYVVPYVTEVDQDSPPPKEATARPAEAARAGARHDRVGAAGVGGAKPRSRRRSRRPSSSGGAGDERVRELPKDATRRGGRDLPDVDGEELPLGLGRDRAGSCRGSRDVAGRRTSA